MFRIDTSRAVLSRPASAAPGTPGYFTNGDPATGYLATQLDGEWFNGVQENLMQVLAAGGIAAVKGPAGDVNLRDAIFAMIDGRTRTVLTNHLNLYVSPSGNDGNPGTIGAPFLTIQAAINYIYRELDLNGWGVYINLAAGTYSGTVYVAGRPVGAPAWWGTPVNIIGNPAAPASHHITLADNTQNLVSVINGAGLFLQGVKLSHTGTPGGLPNLAFAAMAGWIVIDRCEFGAAPSAHLYAHQARIETLPGDYLRTSAAAYTISGGAIHHAVGLDSGYVIMRGSTITLTGTPAFSNAFVLSETAGRFDAVGVGFSGGATGLRYYAGPGGFITTGGGGANFFPGNAPGVTHALGYYG